MWVLVNRAFTSLFDALLWPVSRLDPFLQVAWLGLFGALLGLLVFRFASDQDGITTAKNRIQAHLMELRLFKDDFRVSLLAQVHILRHNLTYLRHALLPMAVMLVPFLAMIVQIESRFAFRALAPGEAAQLSLVVDGAPSVDKRPIALHAPDGVVVETPALRIPGEGEVVWRLRARSPGSHALTLSLGDSEIVKQLRVDENSAVVATELYRAADWNTLLYPQEPPLPDDGPLRQLRVSYPRARSEVLGLSSASWVFVGASIVLGFALRRPLGVTF